jgi:aryl-alcohol dehydrogenase-like predicted oxidoreductase
MKRSGLICLGTVKLGIPDYGFSSSKVSEAFDPVAFLEQVAGEGILRLDTSPRYGESEEIIGRFISQSAFLPTISSKIDGLVPGNKETPEIMMNSVRNSLRKLNLKHLDICYLHQNELEIISDPYVHEGMIELKQRGLILHSGVSLYSFKECEFAIKSGVFDFIQLHINVFDLSFYKNFVQNNSTPTRFTARSLLLQGTLVNRNSISSSIRTGNEMLRYLKQLDEIARETRLSTLELALGFIFSLKNLDHFLIGTSSLQNLKRNLHCLNIELSEEVRARIFALAYPSKLWANPKSWSSSNSGISGQNSA